MAIPSLIFISTILVTIPCLIFISTILVLSSAKDVQHRVIEKVSGENRLATVQVIDNIDKFNAENPDLKSIIHLNGVALQNQKHIFHFGGRTKYDELLARGHNSYSSDTPQNYRFNLSSPPNLELTVTFVEIELETTSKQTNANIVSGGIGEDNIRITVEVLDTTKFAYKVAFYNSASRAQTLAYVVLVGLIFVLSHSLIDL